MQKHVRRDLGRIAIAAASQCALPRAAGAADPIRIRYSVSPSGGLAADGRSSLLAHKIWMEDVDARGGILGRVDQAALAADRHANIVNTIIGDLRCSVVGEWLEERKLMVPFQDIKAGDHEKYQRPGTKVILYPEKRRSGTLRTPYGAAA
jgi:hypothetical protein